jgi:hypothetical protein
MSAKLYPAFVFSGTVNRGSRKSRSVFFNSDERIKYDTD